MGKKGKKVRVDFRRNRSQPARDKGWMRELSAKGAEGMETVSDPDRIHRGGQSRKRTIIEDADVSGLDLREGVVVALRGLYVEVDDGSGVRDCTIRRVLRTLLIGQRQPVAVGDRVLFYVEGEEDGVARSGVIQQVLPRGGVLKRGSSRRVHVIAANVDQALIVGSAAQPDLKPHLIDRYVVSALAGGIHPVICINKMDLSGDDEVSDVAGMYRRIGYSVLLTCVERADSIDPLREVLRDKVTVVVGQSGVGKSSLLNAADPVLKLSTGEISSKHAGGRHTTTTAQLLKLGFGGYVVDTPGVRALELADVSRGELEKYFEEFVPLVAGCKFPDCTHIHESSCMIRRAVDEGRIDVLRYESYVKMFEEERQ